MKWRPGMTQEEQNALDEFWAKEFYESRVRFVAKVKEAMALKSPTRRNALYQKWRAEHGDVAARGWAKFTEACLAGTVSLSRIEEMIKEKP